LVLKQYPKVALALGTISVIYYFMILPPPPGPRSLIRPGIRELHRLNRRAVRGVGGIHITVKGEATPFVNVVFLFVGALLANVLGTTGASMLLIRPWLRMNKYRITAHHVVFFIFIVSNVGGCLTPIGDSAALSWIPKRNSFWWVTEHCWPMWAVGLLILLLMFFVVDYRNYLRAPQQVRTELAEPPDQWRFEGLATSFSWESSLERYSSAILPSCVKVS